MSRAVRRQGAGELAYYLVVGDGPSRGGVVAGPYAEEAAAWERHTAEDEIDTPLSAELLTRREAQEMAL